MSERNESANHLAIFSLFFCGMVLSTTFTTRKNDFFLFVCLFVNKGIDCTKDVKTENNNQLL